MSTPLTDLKICFAGAGSMAEAIIRGLVETRTTLPEQICVFNRSNQEVLAQLQQKYGINTAPAHEKQMEELAQANIVVLAMKPKDAAAALSSMKEHIHPDTLIISVIAGFPIRAMQKILNQKANFVRTMPNTSSSIGYGMTALCFSENTDVIKQAQARTLFQAVGQTVIVPEDQIDLVTGISGSGPAYFYYMMEALIAEGVAGGLDEATAKQLTMQTILGAAHMVKLTEESPSELRSKITSPGGTTQAALEILEERSVAAALRQAAKRAAERAHEIELQLFGE